MEASTAPTAAPRGLRALMRQHPLLSFFVLAYAISWILSIPFILSEWGVLPGDYTVLFIIKSFGPFLAAYIMTGILEGKDGQRRLRGRIRQARAGWLWYVIILLGIPALLVIGMILQPGVFASFTGIQPAFLVSYLVTYLIVALGGGPLGEEPGWRGFALTPMQQRYGPLGGTLLLGVVWTCWHLPDFLTSAQAGGPGTGISAFLTNFPLLLLLIVSLAVLFTWIFNHTRGSIFFAILAHASVNTPQVAIMPLFPAVDITRLNLAALIAYGIPALLIILFTRGRLGYTAVQEQPLAVGEMPAQTTS